MKRRHTAGDPGTERIRISTRASIRLTSGLLLALLCAGIGPQLAAQEARPGYETEALGGGLYVFRSGLRQSIFLIGDQGVIATDPINADVAPLYREAIASITDLPVRYVVYSTSFFDQIAGGRALQDPDTEFVAHENCAANLRATPHPDVVPPTMTYTKSEELSAGSVSLALYYLGPSYGTCLSVMIARPANILYVAKLVTPPVARVPKDPTLGNFYLHNILPFYYMVETLASQQGVEQVVGAFASLTMNADGQFQPAPILAPVSLIAAQRDMWVTLLDIARLEFIDGTPARAMQQNADFDRLAGYAGYDRDHVGIMMRRVYSLYRIGR